MSDGGRRKVGQTGEAVAAAHLTAHGCEVLERNWRCRTGEIDLIVRDGSTVVFCEVKCRTGLGFGTPLESITHAKLARLRGLAGAWLRTHPDVGARFPAIRLDAIGVLLRNGRPAQINHVRGIG